MSQKSQRTILVSSAEWLITQYAFRYKECWSLAVGTILLGLASETPNSRKGCRKPPQTKKAWLPHDNSAQKRTVIPLCAQLARAFSAVIQINSHQRSLYRSEARLLKVGPRQRPSKQAIELHLPFHLGRCHGFTEYSYCFNHQPLA